MNKITHFLLLITLNFNFTFSAAAKTVNCKDVAGIKVVTDYTPEGKAFVRKNIVPLIDQYEEGENLTHLAVNSDKFKSKNVAIKITLLNPKLKPIKSYSLKKWSTDASFPDKKINTINIYKFLTAKLTEPYDTYANLTPAQKAKVKVPYIPYDAKIEIANIGDKPFCSYIYKYGSVSEY